MKIYIALKTL